MSLIQKLVKYSQPLPNRNKAELCSDYVVFLQNFCISWLPQPSLPLQNSFLRANVKASLLGLKS